MVHGQSSVEGLLHGGTHSKCSQAEFFGEAKKLVKQLLFGATLCQESQKERVLKP